MDRDCCGFGKMLKVCLKITWAVRSDTGQFLPGYLTADLHLGVFALHCMFLYWDTPPPLPPPKSFRLALTILSQTFTFTKTIAISSQLFFLLTPPMKMELTECSETSTQFRRRGITQKKENNFKNTAKAWNEECKNIHTYSYFQLIVHLLVKVLVIIRHVSTVNNSLPQVGFWHKYSLDTTTCHQLYLVFATSWNSMLTYKYLILSHF